jgi:AbrB family looped-hinge helix DNA binding protein
MKCRWGLMGHKLDSSQDHFFGSVTVGERGQIVIPAGARTDLGIQPGDKLLVMKTPVHDGLMICKPEALHYMLESMREILARVDSQAEASNAGHKEEQ